MTKEKLNEVIGVMKLDGLSTKATKAELTVYLADHAKAGVKNLRNSSSDESKVIKALRKVHTQLCEQTNWNDKWAVKGGGDAVRSFFQSAFGVNNLRNNDLLSAWKALKIGPKLVAGKDRRGVARLLKKHLVSSLDRAEQVTVSDLQECFRRSSPTLYTDSVELPEDRDECAAALANLWDVAWEARFEAFDTVPADDLVKAAALLIPWCATGDNEDDALQSLPTTGLRAVTALQAFKHPADSSKAYIHVLQKALCVCHQEVGSSEEVEAQSDAFIKPRATNAEDLTKPELQAFGTAVDKHNCVDWSSMSPSGMMAKIKSLLPAHLDDKWKVRKCDIIKLLRLCRPARGELF